MSNTRTDTEISNGSSFLLTDREGQLTFRTFRTVRKSFIRSEYQECNSIEQCESLWSVRFTELIVFNGKGILG